MQRKGWQNGGLAIPFYTVYGLRELIILDSLLWTGLIVSWLLWPGGRPGAQVVLIGVVVLVSLFFRDPKRRVPSEAGVLVAPADGRVTDVTEVEEVAFLGGAAVRIGIFLSVFDVHLNRSPCAGTVAYKQVEAGRCVNAMRWERASSENASASLGLECGDHPAGRVLVRQITGAIARRIVCDCEPGDQLEQGQRYGMIKMGSRTELFVPVASAGTVVVGVGDRVRAGETVLVRYDRAGQESEAEGGV